MPEMKKVRFVVGVIAIVVGGLIAASLIPWDHVIIGLSMVGLGAVLLTP